MEHRTQTTDPVDLPAGTRETEESPLRCYLAALAECGDGAQILSHIRYYLYKAGLAGECELALEVFHETVVAALASEKSYDPSRSAKAWLLGIAAHIVQRRRARYFRQKKHEMQASDLANPTGLRNGPNSGLNNGLDEEELFDRLFVLTHAGPEQEVLARLEVEELLAPLSAEDRQVIVLNLLYEMNGQEVAQALEITPVASRVRFHRALKRLRASGMAQAPSREEMLTHG